MRRYSVTYPLRLGGMSVPSIVVVTTLALEFAFSLPALSQSVTVSSDLSCRRCRIELVRVVTLGDSLGPGMLSNQGNVVSDSRGRFYVTSNFDPYGIKLFDARGTYIRTIGRKGKGPGEFSAAPIVKFTSGDSLLAIDNGSRRATLFSPEHEYVREDPLPLPIREIAVLEQGRAVVTGDARSRDLIGLPLHLIDAMGRVLRSYGTRDERVDVDTWSSRTRVISPSTRGSIWAARTNAYSIERWDTAGRLVATLVRDADWFRPWSTPPGIVGVERRPPEIYAFQTRKDSLWVFVRVNDAQWQPREPAPMPGNPRVTWTPDDQYDDIFDTVLEIIDTKAGRLVATQRFPQRLIGVVGGDLVSSYEEDRNGNPRYVVWRTVLRQP